LIDQKYIDQALNASKKYWRWNKNIWIIDGGLKMSKELTEKVNKIARKLQLTDKRREEKRRKQSHVKD